MLCIFILAMAIIYVFLARAEFNFLSLNSEDIQILKQTPGLRAKKVLNLVDRTDNLVTTILLGQLISIIGLLYFLYRLVAVLMINNQIDALWVGFGDNQWNIFNWFPYGVAVLIGVLFVLIVHDGVNTLSSGKAPLNLALSNARMMNSISIVLRPLSIFLHRHTMNLQRRMEKKRSMSSGKADFDQAIELAIGSGTETEQELDILKSIVKFGDTTVSEIMRPRGDIVALSIEDTFDEVLKVVHESGFSRIPVYGNDLEDIVGILYAKDLILHLKEPKIFNWTGLIRSQVIYVPESKKIQELLKDFQKKRLHMAIVVDEYGGCSGLLTLEDILEEVIGDIRDEFDDDIELDYKKVDDHNYIFEGKTLINDVCKVIGFPTDAMDDVRGDADSIAGLVLEAVGQIPRVKTEIDHGTFRIKVIKVNKRRIEEVQLTLVDK
jgi:putative hemolysin